jgi:hypothetical protein
MQELFLVVGGELSALDGVEFRYPDKLHVVGVFPSETEAHDVWKANAQRTVDNALMRYFIIPIGEAIYSQRPLKSTPELIKHFRDKAIWGGPARPHDGI